MARISKTQLQHHVKMMKAGNTCYINSINLTPLAIGYLRSLIKDGVLIPLETELKKIVYEYYIHDFMNGDIIAPQMEYRKEKNI